MSPRSFAAAVGGVMLLIWLIALAIPVTVDDGGTSVDCGSGFAGLSTEPGSRDAGHDIGAAMRGDFSSSSDLEGDCEEDISARRAWGWPVGGVGAVVLLGALVIQTPPRQPAGSQQSGPDTSTSDGPRKTA